MILYHGSNVQIDAIELSLCHRFKDFGQAFYLSADKNQAEDIAQTRADFLGGSPVVNSFEFDEQVLKYFKNYFDAVGTLTCPSVPPINNKYD